MIDKFENIKHIWIYGAGVFGTIVAEKLIKRGLFIDGFVTSDGKEHFVTSLSLRIVSIDQVFTSAEDTLFVIATDEKYLKEIGDTLANKGYDKTIYWKNIDIGSYWRKHRYHFVDRKKNLGKVCFVLAGYKDFLWNDVFNRLKRFVPEDIEVCVLSSGKYDEILNKIAEENDWSYLYTDYNSVTYIQNIAFSLYEKALFIYKMDEDMFLTEGCFEIIKSTYDIVVEKEPFNVGFVAPLIPINGYGHIRILEKLKKLNEYEKKFDNVLFGCQPGHMLESSIEAAKYMWGYGGNIPRIDDLNDRFSKEKSKYSYCNVRFSIGFILFHRSIWEGMWGFSVSGNSDMGIDEVELCMHCMHESYAIVVAENCVVGHFSFGPQTMGMKEFYLSNHEFFEIR